MLSECRRRGVAFSSEAVGKIAEGVKTAGIGNLVYRHFCNTQKLFCGGNTNLRKIVVRGDRKGVFENPEQMGFTDITVPRDAFYGYVFGKVSFDKPFCFA